MEMYGLTGMEGGSSRFPSLFDIVQERHTTPNPSRPTRQIEILILLASTGRHMVSTHSDVI